MILGKAEKCVLIEIIQLMFIVRNLKSRGLLNINTVELEQNGSHL